ncbi:adenylosuccinate lyase [bacterium]|nr:adenylosuccinate lyase [candidate division CSSED10-310 bacterium]
MIDRYTLPEMKAVWTDESRFHRWLEIEILACEARAELGLIPRDAAVRIRRNASFDVESIHLEEETVRHDVIAFVSTVGKSLGDDACFFHEGLTSSDILDTALATQLVDASGLIEKELILLRKAIGVLAVRHMHTPMIGRTHGVHAEPITFGLKLAVWYEELKRALERFRAAVREIAVGKLSGAVGNFAHLPPDVELYVCRALNLGFEPAATQVVQRDRHAAFVTSLALMAASAEKIATEIRHLQRSEVLEVEEPFGKDQKGSSAMPHKRNPVLCENVAGLARLVRAHAVSALENVALWHERDISHSSVERVILPDASIILHFLLRRLTGIVSGLIVRADRMEQNMDHLHGLIFSQKVLLALTRKGVARDLAYRVVQRNAMKTWERGVPFRTNLENDPDIRKWFEPGQIAGWFDIEPYLAHVLDIMERVGLTPDFTGQENIDGDAT